MYSNTIEKIFILREKKREPSLYEKIVLSLSKIFTYKIPKHIKNIYDYLIFHNKYNINSNQIFSAAINLFLVFFLISALFYYLFSSISYSLAFELFFSIFLTGITLSIYLLIFPFLHKRIVKMSVISESVWVLSYIIISLRNNPSLENAILFVAMNLEGYLASDFYDIIYDLETKRFSSLKEAISFYSKRWREWYPDFAYLISVLLNIDRLYSYDKKSELLDKVQEWYFRAANIKIKSYSSYLKGKVILIVTFLIMLPLVGLILIPLTAVFLPEGLRFLTIFYIYNILLPIISFLLISQVISEIPYSMNIFYKYNDDFKRQKKKNKILTLLIILIAIIFSIPSILHFAELAYNVYRFRNYPDAMYLLIKQELSINRMLNIYLIVFGIGIALGLYFYLRSYKEIELIRKIERVEKELPMLISMIENSAYSGLSFEKSLISISENYKAINPSGLLSEFIEKTINNIYKLRLNLKNAIFHPNYGSMKNYPSLLLREAINLIISASEKSLSSLAKISEKLYKHISEIINLKEELLLSLSDPIVTLKMVCYVLIPIFGGIITSSHRLFINVIIFISQLLRDISPITSMQTFWDLYLQELFMINNMLPPTMFVIPIGFFLIELLAISAYFISGLNSGFNKVVRDYEIGRLLIIGTIIISIIYIMSLFLVESIMQSIFLII